MSEEWGPWIGHDGNGCPCAGMYVQIMRANSDVAEGIATMMGKYWCRVPRQYQNERRIIGIESWWNWVSHHPRFGEIINYRIRKPKGMKMLEQLLQDIPAPAKEKKKERA